MVEASSGLRTARLFLEKHLVASVLSSVLVLIPCFWHRHIEAGDLASHVYNAWLVSLIDQGRVHDLYVTPRSNNVLFDFLLYHTGRITGFENAEKVVVPACVLIFFWGAFALIAAASRRAPWFLSPAIAMVAYGFTFEMGFMNYYLSIGLAFLALALLWRKSTWTDRLLAAVLAIFIYLAHPVGLATFVGMLVYVKLSQMLRGWWRLLPFGLAMAALLALHLYLLRIRTAGWVGASFFLLNGADQLILFGLWYAVLAWAVLLLTLVALFIGLRSHRLESDSFLAIQASAGLWLALLISAALIPQAMWLPQYSGVVAMFTTRATCISAILVILMLGCVRAQWWHVAGFGIVAIVFFSFLYRDTGRMNRLEMQAQSLLQRLPQGTRVLSTLGPSAGSRIWFVLHIVDRACLGHCFTYSNYEPSTGQFWIRARLGSRTADPVSADTDLQQIGIYKVKPEDLPLVQIYQCRLEDFDHLCMRELKAGEKNCPNCNNPFYALMHSGGQWR